MYSFKKLRKAAKLNIGKNPVKVAVLGNTATQFFSAAFTGYVKLNDINATVLDTDYNQIDFQLIDPASETHSFEPKYIILWPASEKLYEEFLDLDFNDRASFADNYITKIKTWWDLCRAMGARIIQPNLVEFEDNALGQYSLKVDSTFIKQIRKLNYFIMEAISECNDVYPVDLLSVHNRMGREQFYDPVLYYNAKMPIALNALPYVAKAFADVIISASGKIKKCIVLDLDNTLWGGVIGDDGMGGIEIGELGRGHAFTNFQKWLKELKECGIILAVCSKNNEEVAKEPFEKHEEMVLRLSDISVFVANWEDKATNIKLIQETLNIGMDSMVFIDDNPFERNLVKERIPEITVPDLPEDPALYLEFLIKENLFDSVSFAKDMKDRTKQYQQEFERKKLSATYESIDDYLKDLNMISEAGPFTEERYARIAQLTQRSNQFNLRTIRYTEDEIAKVAKSDDYLTLYFTLSDKFGDYGLISVIILKKVNQDELFVDTWLMSCRVLKRGMESFVVNKIMNVARENGFKTVTGEYLETPKNKMVSNLFVEMGFAETENKHYSIDVNNYCEKPVWIKEQ